MEGKPDLTASQENLLIIDDDEQVSAMISALLRLEGYAVDVQNEPRQGLDRALTRPFDLVLLDLNMPGIDGFEILSSLRQRFSMIQLPVIMLTGTAETKNVVEAINRQANGYVTKPVETKVLLHRIRQVLTFRREEQARREREELQHDPITGLPTRSLFTEQLGSSLARANRRSGYFFAVMCLDLDRFNVINDSLGHDIGTQLLIAMARRLQEMLRTGDAVSMFENHEFMVLLDDIGNVNDATSVASKVLEAISQPFNVANHEVVTTCSIGIALGHEASISAETIIRDAHTAMLHARSLGGCRFETFESTMHTRATKRLQLETDLRRAIERNEFVLHYQPVVWMNPRHLYGFETLVRWQRNGGPLVFPADFIPLAEETGIIVPLGLWVMREACRQAREWQLRYPDNPPLISINLSGKQFLQPDLFAQIERILSETQVTAKFIEFEITESTMMHNTDTAADILTQMKKLDVHLAIDDFGTGYSSLSYLHRFPFDMLKIDRSFILRIEEDEEALKIVQTIILLARNLGLHVVAEGVETRKQWEHLRELECELIQGFYFSRPVPAAEAEKVIVEDRDAYSTQMG